MNFINSSNIADYDHDPQSGDLVITFKSGRRYKYKGVSTQVADGLQASLSPGRYVWDNIRDQYEVEEL